MNSRSFFYDPLLFTEEQLAFRDMAYRLAVDKLLPIREELDRESKPPDMLHDDFARAGFFNCYIEERFGGLGLGMTEMTIAIEEISRICAGSALYFAATALGAHPIHLDGNDGQKERFLRPVAEGKKLAAFALTEPNAGSDATSIITSAVRDGDHYVLNGTKCFITNGGIAGIYTVITMTDPAKCSRGATAFVVEDGTPGFRYGKKENKLGIRASETRELIFEECRVPAENMLKGEGKGFIVVLNTLNRTRIGIAAQALGIAQGVLDEIVTYTKEREQFGMPLIQQPFIRIKLAELRSKIELGHLHCYTLCKAFNEGLRHKGMPLASSISKVFCSELAVEAAEWGIQFAGGNGFINEYPFAKFLRDAMITRIYEGANQVLLDNIGKSLAK